MKKHEQIDQYVDYLKQHYINNDDYWYFVTMIDKENHNIKYRYKLFSFLFSIEDITEKLKLFGFEFDENHYLINIDEKIFEENKHLIIANELGLL